jgi:hypothetical protein
MTEESRWKAVSRRDEEELMCPKCHTVQPGKAQHHPKAFKCGDCGYAIKNPRGDQGTQQSLQFHASKKESLEEGLAVQHHGTIGNTMFVSVNGTKYGYEPKHSEDPNYISLGDMESKFKGMLKHSSGKALAWLKKRSNLASGSVKGQSKIVTDGLESQFYDDGMLKEAKDSYGMKLIPHDRLKQMAKDGKVEMETDVHPKTGRVGIRWTASGKRETITTKEGFEFSYSDEEMEIFERMVEKAEKAAKKEKFVGMLKEDQYSPVPCQAGGKHDFQEIKVGGTIKCKKCGEHDDNCPCHKCEKLAFESVGMLKEDHRYIPALAGHKTLEDFTIEVNAKHPGVSKMKSGGQILFHTGKKNVNKYVNPVHGMKVVAVYQIKLGHGAFVKDDTR